MPRFIPKQYKKTPITVRMDSEKLEHLDSMAAKYGVSRSAFINQCIDFTMANMPKPKIENK